MQEQGLRQSGGWLPPGRGTERSAATMFGLRIGRWRLVGSTALALLFPALAASDVHVWFTTPGLRDAAAAFTVAAASMAVVALVALATLVLRPAPPWVAGAAFTVAATVVAASATLHFIGPLVHVRNGDLVHAASFDLTAAEGYGLAALTASAIRRCAPRTAVPASAATLAAFVAAVALRPHADAVMVQFWGFAPAPVLGLVVGLYLRAVDTDRRHQHEQQAEISRRGERLALARDLHDIVAHHVTGIVVQAQAVRHIAAGDPTTREALGDIERAGAEALQAMRRLVGTLREPGAAVPLQPIDLQTTVATLVEEAVAAGLPARLVLDGGAVTAVPPEVAVSAERVVQEALTNARRHAVGVSRVEVRLRVDDDGVVLSVRDNGRAAGHPRPGAGGYGLVGMRERVELLGGEFGAGPAAGGWLVQARIPLSGGDR